MSGGVVHVVDDDAAMLDSLEFLLSSAGVEVRAYSSALNLLDRFDALEPGCIVTDVRMPGMSGLDLVRELKRRGARHPVIVLTGHADVALAVESMKAGVLDFVEKPFDERALLSAVEVALSQGETEAERVEELAHLSTRLSQLTPRERDVFAAVAGGESNKSAAQKLGISPRTVEVYRANVMIKMQAGRLSDLVRMAMRLEIV